MTALTPAPSALGTGSPALGPWFSNAGLTLGAPAADLSVAVSLAAGDRWLPPAGGVVGYYIATAQRPAALAALRQADGTQAFATGRLVVLFQLLPDVAARLGALMSALPSPDGTTPATAVPTRPVPAAFAFEVSAAADVALLSNLVVPALTGTNAEKAREAGMQVVSGNLTNARSGAAIYRHPGDATDADQTLITNNTGAALNGSLWAFDSNGRPIDPGAVAAWWNHLATTVHTNLWADSANQRTCAVANNLAVHLVNAHEGPLTNPLLGRLNLTGWTGAGAVRTKTGAAGAATIGFTAAPAVPAADDAPIPLAALLPHGTYGSSVSLWAATPIARDFCRVAAVDVEAHLTGQPRVAPGGATAEQTRRAADQNRESTRIKVGRTQAPALRATLDAGADEVINVFTNATNTAHLVAGALDRDYGGLSALTGLPAVDPPTAAPAVTVVALTGGGATVSGTVTGQRALVSCNLGAGLAGAWVRVWTQGFNAETGRHTRLDGGGGVVRATGDVDIVVGLADGAVPPDAAMGLDLMIVTAQGTQLFADIRFDRPTPIGGSAVALSATTGNVLICETGQIQTGPGVTNIPPGFTLVQLSSPPALVDRTSVPLAAWRNDTVIRNLTTGDVVQLSHPAFKSGPAGDTTTTLATSGATVSEHGRNLLLLGTNPGDPLPTMERLEVAATGTAGTGPVAAVGGGPTLSRYHELLPHTAGHPGAPAASEIHGTGVSLNGDAAVLVREYTRERTAGNTFNLATAASTPLTFPGGTGPSCWAAPLRTVAYGVEMEVSSDLLMALLNVSSTYPWGSNTVQAISDWLAGYGITLPTGVAAAANEIARAVDRRMLVGSRGAREGLIAMTEAIRRAEDLVYIETPAIDDQAVGPAADQFHWLGALKQRMTDRPGLQVLICFPNLAMPGTPSPLNKVRTHLAAQAFQSLRQGANADRVAVFCPAAGPGRTLRIASTTVIVDDVWAMTGTTHLWRRGLTFDSSLAVALFDEQLQGGRPAQITNFRQQLIADRLGLQTSFVPTDPADLIALIRRQVTSGGGGRIAFDALQAPNPAPSGDELLAWNPDGSPDASANPIGWISEVIAGILGSLVN